MRTSAAAGFTYLELTLSVISGAAALAGAYHGYRLMAERYESGSADRESRESGYAALEFIAADLRMAGRLAYDSDAATYYPPPDQPVAIGQKAEGECCDTLSVIYDKGASDRIRVTYYGATRGEPGAERHALYADIDRYDGAGGWNAVYEEMFVADYVESFDVTPRMNTRGGSLMLADVELTLRAKHPDAFIHVFAAPAYAGAEDPPEAEDRYKRHWFSKTVALRNMEKY